MSLSVHFPLLDLFDELLGEIHTRLLPYPVTCVYLARTCKRLYNLKPGNLCPLPFFNAYTAALATGCHAYVMACVLRDAIVAQVHLYQPAATNISFYSLSPCVWAMRLRWIRPSTHHHKQCRVRKEAGGSGDKPCCDIEHRTRVDMMCLMGDQESGVRRSMYVESQTWECAWKDCASLLESHITRATWAELLEALRFRPGEALPPEMEEGSSSSDEDNSDSYPGEPLSPEMEEGSNSSSSSSSKDDSDSWV